jgi:hypothetical protein
MSLLQYLLLRNIDSDLAAQQKLTQLAAEAKPLV